MRPAEGAVEHRMQLKLSFWTSAFFNATNENKYTIQIFVRPATGATDDDSIFPGLTLHSTVTSFQMILILNVCTVKK